MVIKINDLKFIAKSFASMNFIDSSYCIESVAGNFPDEIKKEFYATYNSYCKELHKKHAMRSSYS